MSVAYVGRNSRTERPRKTKIGTEIAHVTRDSDTTFKVKGQGHQAALLSAALPRKAAAAVSVGTYSARGKYCYVASARQRARRLGAHGGEERGRGHNVSPRAQLVYCLDCYNCLARTAFNVCTNLTAVSSHFMKRFTLTVQF